MTIGSLFSGYGGLDLAAQNVFGGHVAWYSEIEPAACQVLAAHYPGIPNLGDITTVDWTTVPPVDVLTGGYPCQPFSHAGHRKGTNDERHLWPYVRDAIRHLRPRITILENVRGHLTLGFDTVLTDLAELGMSARWGTLRAADAGAPHGRARLFIIATPNTDQPGLQGTDPRLDMGTRREASGGHASQGRDSSPSDTQRQRHDGRRTEEPTLESVSGRADAQGSPVFDWGRYQPAIERWERVLGRPAPAPTVLSGAGRHRLNPLLVEWLMGLPEGWVTGHGLTSTQELRMLGNGVVPQQAETAIRTLLDVA